MAAVINSVYIIIRHGPMCINPLIYKILHIGIYKIY